MDDIFVVAVAVAVVVAGVRVRVVVFIYVGRNVYAHTIEKDERHATDEKVQTETKVEDDVNSNLVTGFNELDHIGDDK